ncbi:MAG: LAGLIDADG family homing endonuclease [Gammaproteobacteria bacterium]|nr:LAGLIDADG family homing endonuclease [Gammaproteobacteria bacterium]
MQAAYLAGLVDGEGTVTLSRRHKSENRQLVVSISNTELPLLQYVLEVVGVGKITSKKTYRSHHAPGYTYSISNRQGLSLLKQIHPCLRTYEAKRTALIIRDYIRLTPGNGRYTAEISQARKVFEREVMSIKS